MPQKKKNITLQLFYEEFQSRMGALESGMGGVEGRMGGLENEMTGLKDEMSGLDGRMGSLESSQRSVLAQLATINRRLVSLEEITSRLGDRLDTLHSLCEGLGKGFENLTDEYHAITAGLKRLEERFDQFEADRITERIASLERKVEALERGRN